MTDVVIDDKYDAQVVTLTDGDILMIRRPSDAADNFTESLLALAEVIAGYGVSVAILEVESFDQLQLVTDKQLDALGLARKSEVLAYKREPFKDLIREWDSRIEEEE